MWDLKLKRVMSMPLPSPNGTAKIINASDRFNSTCLPLVNQYMAPPQPQSIG